jgi:RNA polymerase sigma factor (sigma-70 family)
MSFSDDLIQREGADPLNTQSPKDDAILVSKVISGDPEAWERFVKQFSDIVYKTCDECSASLHTKELYRGYFCELRNFRALKAYKGDRGTLQTYLIADCHSYCMKIIFSISTSPDIVEAAWKTLERHYKPLILGKIRRTLYEKERESLLPEDVLLTPEYLYSQLYIHLMEEDCKRIKQFHGKGSFNAWLNTVVVRFVIDAIRNAPPPHIQLPIHQDGDGEEDAWGGSPTATLADSMPTPEEQYEKEAEVRELIKIIDGLSGQMQLYLSHLYWGNLDREEIADIMGVSIEEVYKIAEKTMAELRTKMGAIKGKKSKHNVI